jgi:FMN phosphatase YigB (HAD superfamily)
MPSRVEEKPFSSLLFDLDGTLLDVHMPVFLEAYFPLLAPRFGAESDVPSFKKNLLDAVRLMLQNKRGDRPLDRIFLESFAAARGMTPEGVRTKFDDFHRRDFDRLRPLTRPFPEARPLLEKALSLGYELAIATNPVFMAEPIEARIRWAGLEGIPWSFVSSAGNMHFCKPHPEYYTEVLDHLGRRPEECVMIGNDPAKDLPAHRVGITTYYLPYPEEHRRPETADHTGTLKDLSLWLDSLGPSRADVEERRNK